MKSGDMNKTAKIILMRNGKLLLLRSRRSNKFHFPGGHLEIGESFNDAVKREVSEETGLTLTKSKAIITSHDFVLYIGKAIESPVKLSIEHSDYVWASPDSALKLPVCQYTMNNLKQVFRFKKPKKITDESLDDLDE